MPLNLKYLSVVSMCQKSVIVALQSLKKKRSNGIKMYIYSYIDIYSVGD